MKAQIERFLRNPKELANQTQLMIAMNQLSEIVVANLDARNDEGGDETVNEAQTVIEGLHLDLTGINYQPAMDELERLAMVCADKASANIKLEEQQRNARLMMSLTNLSLYVQEHCPEEAKRENVDEPEEVKKENVDEEPEEVKRENVDEPEEVKPGRGCRMM